MRRIAKGRTLDRVRSTSRIGGVGENIMNKKIARGSLAGVAVIALLAGGGTFASWSDFDQINGNETAAGHLKLDLNSTGSINNVGGAAMAPGESRTIDF